MTNEPVAWLACATDASESSFVTLFQEQAEAAARDWGWSVEPLFARRKDYDAKPFAWGYRRGPGKLVEFSTNHAWHYGMQREFGGEVIPLYQSPHEAWQVVHENERLKDDLSELRCAVRDLLDGVNARHPAKPPHEWECPQMERLDQLLNKPRANAAT